MLHDAIKLEQLNWVIVYVLQVSLEKVLSVQLRASTGRERAWGPILKRGQGQKEPV